jgi:hypothetical protein
VNKSETEIVHELKQIEESLRVLTLRVTRIRAEHQRTVPAEPNPEIPVNRPLQLGDRVRFRLRGGRYATGTVERITGSYVHIRIPGQFGLIRRAPHNVTHLPI